MIVEKKIFHGGKTKLIFENLIFRSSHPEVFLENGVLKICSKFTGEQPYPSVISIKLLRHGCSSVNLLRIFRTPFLKNTSGRLLLNLSPERFCLLVKLTLKNAGLP